MRIRIKSGNKDLTSFFTRDPPFLLKILEVLEINEFLRIVTTESLRGSRLAQLASLADPMFPKAFVQSVAGGGKVLQ